MEMKRLGLLLLLLGFTINGWAMTKQEVRDNMEIVDRTLNRFTDDMEWIPYINEHGRVQFLPINPQVLTQYKLGNALEVLLAFLEKHKEIPDGSTKTDIQTS